MKNRLAQDHVVVARSENPESIYCYSPGLIVLPSGRYVATMDFSGPGAKKYPTAVKFRKYRDFWYTGHIYTSDDRGETWQQRQALPMLLMRPFLAGGVLYAIGVSPDLGIAKSLDEGETWSEVTHFSQDQVWHQAPSNVWYKDDYIYLVMEHETDFKNDWPMYGIAPVLMRGKVTDDLTKKENWTFASELPYYKHIKEEDIKELGMPFLPGQDAMGWLETNVVQLLNEKDYFYDPTGRTFHLFLRTHTAGHSWPGAVLKVEEKEDGSMETGFVYAPSGKRMVYIPIPGGGESKFHILYDEKTKTYWLLTNQFVDSYVDRSRLTKNDQKGYGRSRLVLYYSVNCFDWLYAGMVAAGETPLESRSYASMAFDGEDLLVLSRSGDAQILNGHDNNLITFHRVKNFRDLIDL